MTTTANKLKMTGILHIIAAIVLAASFFMPWVMWDGAAVKGVDMPTGSFFKIAEDKSGIANPFPGLSFAFYIFLLIPALAVVSVAATLLKKNTLWLSIPAGVLSISLTIIFYLFTQSLDENEAIESANKSIWLYIQFLSAILLILVTDINKWIFKIGLILALVFVTYFGFKIIENNLINKGHEATKSAKTDFVVGADVLINEFLTNDTASNKKYTEKMLEVNGMVNSAEIAADSTSTIKFADTTGSYAIFSIEKTELEKVKNIKSGDLVTVKGVCSGSIFSDILGTTSINFKRSVIKQ